MVEEKSSSVRRFLSYRVIILSGKNLTVLTSIGKKYILISGIRFTYKFVIPNTKGRQKDFFRIFEILA